MGVYGNKNVKTLLVLQFLLDQFQFFSATTSGGPWQNLFVGILIFRFFDFFTNIQWEIFPIGKVNGENQNVVYLENGCIVEQK